MFLVAIHLNCFIMENNFDVLLPVLFPVAGQSVFLELLLGLGNVDCASEKTKV